MLYMIVEDFRGGDAVPVYRRFRDRGRLAPEGLRYVASWVTDDLRRCFQVMECGDERLLREWMAAWEDIVDFEVIQTESEVEALLAENRLIKDIQPKFNARLLDDKTFPYLMVTMGEDFPIWSIPAPVFDRYAGRLAPAVSWHKPFELVLEGVDEHRQPSALSFSAPVLLMRRSRSACMCSQRAYA